MKQLFFLCTLILLLIVMSHGLNAQNLLWAKNGSGLGEDMSRSVSTDGAGNSYVTGYFEYPSISFGTVTLTNTMISAGALFVVKYDANGNVLWAKSAEGVAGGTDIFSDVNGNVFVTGSFSSATLNIGGVILSNAGRENVFIAKYDTNGNVIWAKNEGGSGDDMGRGISADANGNVYVIGDFYSSVIAVANTSLTNASNHSDIFVLKYDSNGNAIWAKRLGGTNFDTGASITVDANGNVYTTGSFFSPTLSVGTTSLSNGGMYDGFLMKYDANGNVLWIKSVGGTGMDFGRDICTDAFGNVLVAGTFGSASLSIGGTTLVNSTLFTDIFVTKYDANGSALWAKRVGGTDTDAGSDVCTDANGNVYATGIFSNSPITFAGTTFTNSGGTDIIVMKYDAYGNELWAKSAGGADDDFSEGMCLDQVGRIYLTGRYYSSNFSIENTSLPHLNYGDVFVAKFAAVITGIETNTLSESAHFFPNPFCAQTTLRTTHLLHNASIFLDNCFGESVMAENNIQGQTIVISRNELTAGLYFFRLIQDNKVLSSGTLLITDE